MDPWREKRERESVCVCVWEQGEGFFVFVNFYSIYSRTPFPLPFLSPDLLYSRAGKEGGLGVIVNSSWNQ